MKTDPKAERRVRGSALVEFTIVVLLLLAMMSATWRVGYLLWQESVVRAAVANAADMVANTPALELQDQDAADDITDQAEDLIRLAIERSGNERGAVTVTCSPTSCAAAANPARVRVEATAYVKDAVFAFMGYEGYPLTVEMEVPYGGRSPTQ